MAESNCDNCTLRKKYDTNPKSLLGRFWRWHINWCPGWKQYKKTLSEEKWLSIKEKYQLK